MRDGIINESDLPHGWTRSTIAEAFEFRRGLTYKKSDEVEHSENAVLRANNIDRDRGDLDLSDIRYIRSEIEIPEKKKVVPNSLLVCTASGSRNHLGKIAFVDDLTDFAFGGFMGLLLPREGVDAKFAYYFTRSDAYWEHIAGLSAGANINNLRFNDLGTLEIPLPPLQEQKRIVAVLDQAFAALDCARANAESNLADAEELYQGTIRELFEKRTSWGREDLNSRVHFIDYRGKTPPKRDSGIRLITAKNVRMGYIKSDPREFVLETAYDEWMTRGFPEAGDILFTTEAPLANVAELDTSEKVVIGQRLITMQTRRDEIYPRFLKWSLLSPQMQHDIREKGTGATVTGIKASLLKKIPFYVPPNMEDQMRIAEQCESAFSSRDQLVELYRAKIADIADLRQSLLQKAFSGQLTA